MLTLQEKLNTLNEIKASYGLNYDLYRRLRLCLKYDHTKDASDQLAFLAELPQNLRIELSMLMHKDLMNKVNFFKGKPAHFIAFIGPLLKPVRVSEDSFVYREGDPVEDVYFMVQG